MSIAFPFLAFLLAGAFAAYHRLRLAVWAAITRRRADRLLAARRQSTSRPSSPRVLVALIAVPLLVPNIRKPLHHRAAAERSTPSCCRRCRTPSAPRWKPARSASKASCSPASRTGTQLLSQPKPRTHRRGAGLPRRPVRRAVPDDRRLGHHPRPRRPAAGDVGLHQAQQVLRPEHPEGIRRPGLLRADEPQGDPEAGVDLAPWSAPPSACPTRSARPNC